MFLHSLGITSLLRPCSYNEESLQFEMLSEFVQITHILKEVTVSLSALLFSHNG